MINSKQINSLVETIANAIPEQLENIPKNTQKNMRSTLSSAFEKMNLVTREEFDLQTNVLAKTRQKLESLEKKIAEFEK